MVCVCGPCCGPGHRAVCVVCDGTTRDECQSMCVRAGDPGRKSIMMMMLARDVGWSVKIIFFFLEIMIDVWVVDHMSVVVRRGTWEESPPWDCRLRDDGRLAIFFASRSSLCLKIMIDVWVWSFVS